MSNPIDRRGFFVAAGALAVAGCAGEEKKAPSCKCEACGCDPCTCCLKCEHGVNCMDSCPDCFADSCSPPATSSRELVPGDIVKHKGDDREWMVVGKSPVYRTKQQCGKSTAEPDWCYVCTYCDPAFGTILTSMDTIPKSELTLIRNAAWWLYANGKAT